jgi:translation initiation factor 2 alpha subunit (eIF-2alpha)
MIDCVLTSDRSYNKSKMVHSIMRHVAEKTETPIEELYQNIGWPLNKKFGHSIDAFKLSITNPDVWDDVTFPSEVVKQELLSYIGKRLMPQPTKVRSDIEGKNIDIIEVALSNCSSHLFRVRRHRRREDCAPMRRGKQHYRYSSQGQACVATTLRYV